MSYQTCGMPDECICGLCHIEQMPPDEPEMIDVPVIADTFPVVLYLGSEDDREELIQAMMEVHPNMRSRKL